MKSGISLVDMAKEIQRQADLKADYMLDTRSLRLEPFDSKLYLNAYDQSGVPALEPLEVNSIAHRQIGTHLKIPAAYYDKMLEEYPQLLAQNVNAWFQREPSVRMIRTIEGTARAFLSNRYRRIDNLDIAGIVLPVLQDMERMHFESCQLTESRICPLSIRRPVPALPRPCGAVHSPSQQSGSDDLCTGGWNEPPGAPPYQRFLR